MCRFLYDFAELRMAVSSRNHTKRFNKKHVPASLEPMYHVHTAGQTAMLTTTPCIPTLPAN